MLLDYPLSEKENKIRKRWLQALVCSHFLPPLCFFLIPFFAPDVSEVAFKAAFISLVWGLISFSIVFHCTYRKSGAILLMLFLIFFPFVFIKFVVNWVLIFLLFNAEVSASFNICFVFGFFIFISIGVWNYLLSLKLRRINKLRKANNKIRLAKEDPDYLDSIVKIRGISEIDALDQQFSDLVRKWPQFQSISCKEYEVRKSELLNQTIV